MVIIEFVGNVIVQIAVGMLGVVSIGVVFAFLFPELILEIVSPSGPEPEAPRYEADDEGVWIGNVFVDEATARAMLERQ